MAEAIDARTGGPEGSGSTAHPRPPRLAGDMWRMLLSLVISMVAVFATVLIWARIAFAGAAPAEIADAQAMINDFAIASVGFTWFYFGLAYGAITAFVFRRFRGARLASVARTSTTRRVRDRVAMLLIGGDEIVFPIATVLMALIGVVVLVLYPRFAGNGTLAIGAVAGLVGGWLMMVVSFSTSYLREWAKRASIRFPDDDDAGPAPERRFGDFVYLAVQFATAFSSADVHLFSPRARMLAALNSVVAFLFNTVTVGMFLSLAVAAALTSE